MARQFAIPDYYRSPVILRIKSVARAQGPSNSAGPIVLDLGPLCIKVARRFGFCFGVENAIEIAYRALEQNPGRRIFLLSEMIHNPRVNRDLSEKGIRFLRTPEGKQLVPFEELRRGDIVIIPAFGTTRELLDKLHTLGVETEGYDATCPFVEKVWRRAAQLGRKDITVVIHGKHSHEETRATFSHASMNGPSLVIRDLEEAKILAELIEESRPASEFEKCFAGRYSEGFDPQRHLRSIGVVNQTTMLAEETLSISRLLREAMRRKYGAQNLELHFADTRDTLCYATNENQDAVHGLISAGGDVALVVGGYNSSNTSHLAELLTPHVPTYYIQDADEILDASQIRHLDLVQGKVVLRADWLPKKRPLSVLLTAGASCPDSLVDQVLYRVLELFGLESELPRLAQDGKFTKNS